MKINNRVKKSITIFYFINLLCKNTTIYLINIKTVYSQYTEIKINSMYGLEKYVLYYLCVCLFIGRRQSATVVS